MAEAPDQMKRVYEELGRKLVPWLVGIALALGSIIGMQILQEQQMMNRKLTKLETAVAVININLEYLKARNELARPGTH